jgi:hypothetical protein
MSIMACLDSSCRPSGSTCFQLDFSILKKNEAVHLSRTHGTCFSVLVGRKLLESAAKLYAVCRGRVAVNGTLRNFWPPGPAIVDTKSEVSLRYEVSSLWASSKTS